MSHFRTSKDPGPLCRLSWGTSHGRLTWEREERERSPLTRAQQARRKPASWNCSFCYCNGVFTQEQDNDKTKVEPVHSYDAFHAVVAVKLPCRCRRWCERHNRNAQIQHLSCRCLVFVLSLSCSGVKTPFHTPPRDIFIGGGGAGGIAPPWILTTPKGPEFGRHMLWWD